MVGVFFIGQVTKNQKKLIVSFVKYLKTKDMAFNFKLQISQTSWSEVCLRKFASGIFLFNVGVNLSFSL